MNVMSKIVDVENERPQVIWATGYGFKPVKLPAAKLKTAINRQHACVRFILFMGNENPRDLFPTRHGMWHLWPLKVVILIPIQ